MWRTLAGIALAVAGASLMLALSESPAVEPAKVVPPTPTENDVLSLAAVDGKTLDRESQLFTRWLSVTSADKEEAQALAFVLNMLSRSTNIVPLTDGSSPRTSGIHLLGKDKLMLVRVDLRLLFPKESDLKDALRAWESFQFDPRWNLLITKDTLRFAAGIDIPRQERKVKRMVKRQVQEKDKEGRLLFFAGDKNRPVMIDQDVEVNELVQTDKLGDGVSVLRVVPDWLDKELVAMLVTLTGSQAPVVDSRYFLFRSMSAVQEDGLFKDVWGGLYYDFAGVKESKDKTATDEDLLFDQLGVGDVKKGVTARQVYDKVSSERRSAMFRSKVTGKPRRFDMLRTLEGDVSNSQGILGISHDPQDKDVDIGRHPIFNLANVEDRAREVIWEGPNGMHKYAAFNGAGNLQREVPFDVASDSTIPTPFTQRLQPGISCLRCHGLDGGWKPAKNDVQTVFKKFNVLAELSDGSKSQLEVLDRIRGQYQGDFGLKLFPRGNDDWANSTLRATGPWKRSKDQVDVVRLAAAKVGEMYAAYWYKSVDARAALLDLGVTVDAKANAAEKLESLLSKSPDGREDARVAGLLSGLEIGRVDWDLVRSFVRGRMIKQKGDK